MAINIVEELLTPEVPKMLANEQIHVYVPMASYDNVGIAKYDADDFIVADGKVNIKDIYTERYDTSNIPYYIQYSANGIKTPNVWYYNDTGAILVTYKAGVQSEFDVTNNRFRELTIVDGAVTVVGEWLDAPENIIELNRRLRLKFFLGTKNEIESIAEKEDDVIYVATDGMPDIEELIYRIGVLEEQLKNCTCGN